MRKSNPFKATLGSTPPLLVGRSHIIDDFQQGIMDGPGAHERISLVTGPRGIGKTVILNEFEQVALNEGWTVFSETATPGFTDRLTRAILKKLDTDTRLTSINFSILGAGFGTQWVAQTYKEPTFREAASLLLDALVEVSHKINQEPTGILITLDELHHLHVDDIIQFSSTIQHLVREDRQIAVVMAGIPSSVKPLLAEKRGTNPVTFLRRANRIDLGKVSDDDVREALNIPAKEAGFSWTTEALEFSTKACAGYPFMIQLVGMNAVRKLKDGNIISYQAAIDGVERARRRLGQLVHEPALADLSPIDRTYLLLMAQNDGPSQTKTIAQGLDQTPQYANTYRNRLIEAQMIYTPRTGYVDFELPYLREYLRTHAASLMTLTTY